MNLRKLSDVCEIIMGQSPDSSSYNESGEGLPFFQGKADFGELYPIPRMYCNKPLKIAITNDILMSVRAPVGDVNIATEECCIGRGVAAIRSKENIDFKYLYYVLEFMKERIASLGTGSTFKAISKIPLSSIEIPVPTLEQQIKIVNVLDKVKDAINKRHYQLAALDELTQSVFLDMFGDPVVNNRNLSKKRLGETGELKRGMSKHRPRNAPELLGGPYPLIQTGDVSRAGLFIENYRSTYSELGLKQSKMWEAGTLCITIAANIAETSILKFDACFPDSVVGYKPFENMNSIFVHYWFSFFQKILENNAPESAQKNINLKILNEIEIITPPIDQQNEFTNQVMKIYEQKIKLEDAKSYLEDLYSSLLQQAFKG